MSAPVRVMIWIGVILLLFIVAGKVPKEEHTLLLAIALSVLLWLGLGALVVVRFIFRFITRS